MKRRVIMAGQAFLIVALLAPLCGCGSLRIKSAEAALIQAEADAITRKSRAEAGAIALAALKPWAVLGCDTGYQGSIGAGSSSRFGLGGKVAVPVPVPQAATGEVAVEFETFKMKRGDFSFYSRCSIAPVEPIPEGDDP